MIKKQQNILLLIRLVEEQESDPFDTEVKAKEVVFTKAENGKYFWKEIE